MQATRERDLPSIQIQLVVTCGISSAEVDEPWRQASKANNHAILWVKGHNIT